MIEVSLILMIILLYLFRQWHRKFYSYWTVRGFASDKSASFPLGSFKDAGYKLHTAEKFDQLYQELCVRQKNKLAGLFFIFSHGMAIYDPELIRQIFVKDFYSFHDHYLYYNEKDDPISANLLTIEGDKWKDRRSKLTPVFSSGKIKAYFNIVDSIADKFVAKLHENSDLSDEIEMYEWLSRYTTDVIGNIAFGLECDCLNDPNTEFRKYGKRFFAMDSLTSALRFLFINSCQRISRWLGMMLNDKEAADFFLNVFKKTIKFREDNNIERQDYVHLLLQLKKSGQLELNEMAAEGFIFYFGGFHTSASLMSFILYELALNPTIQARLRAEIQAQSDEKFSYDSLMSLKYLDMVVNEALRKYPPVHVLTRKCTKDYPVEGSSLVIPKGTQVTIPIYSIHRDDKHFPDALKFDPERFSEENVKNIRPFTYLPFGM